MNLNFRSFRTRILVFFLGLLILVQVVAFISVNAANHRNARQEIDNSLEVTSGVFQQLIATRNQRLLEAARLLSGDFAFKQAYASHDRLTLLSALDNHRMRIRADIMALVSLDNELLAYTLNPTAGKTVPDFPEVIEAAMETERGEYAAVIMLGAQHFQVVVVPLLAPSPVGFIVIGFVVGDALVEEMRALTVSDVSLATASRDAPWKLFASTLPQPLWSTLGERLSEAPWDMGKSAEFKMDADDYVSLVTPLTSTGESPVIAILQRSLSGALAPYNNLRLVLLGLFGTGLLLSIIGGTLIARTVTRPVLKLAQGASRIEEGDYSARVEIKQRDELGRLAQSFNRMGKGLAERDRVRSLLGQVVSSAIAEKLLSKKIELGGEECEVTILFSDLRGFTTMCETKPPQEVVSLLNAHLTRQTEAVESNGGVVNQYVGDAIMALFGAPLRHEDDPQRAVQAALDMVTALESLNTELIAQNKEPLAIGVGINTAPVIAGNMGSLSRLTYTVVGDGVPLAARLEALTKFYQTPVIVNQSTRDLVDDFLFQELDKVCVKGKNKPSIIYAPLGRAGELTQAKLDELTAYEQALVDYRAKHWEAARAAFIQLKVTSPKPLYNIYLERIEEFLHTPPGLDWDGTHVFQHK